MRRWHVFNLLYIFYMSLINHKSDASDALIFVSYVVKRVSRFECFPASPFLSHFAKSYDVPLYV